MTLMKMTKIRTMLKSREEVVLLPKLRVKLENYSFTIENYCLPSMFYI